MRYCLHKHGTRTYTKHFTYYAAFPKLAENRTREHNIIYSSLEQCGNLCKLPFKSSQINDWPFF